MATIDGSEDDFSVMGTYQVSDAQKLLEAFDSLEIEYEVDFNDGLAEINPLIAAEGGTFGTAAQVTIHVRSDQRQLADKVYFALFKDYLPNYNAEFFDNSRTNRKTRKNKAERVHQC